MSNEISIAVLAADWGTSENYVRNLIAKGKLQKTRRGFVDYDSAARHRKLRSPAHVTSREVVKAQGGQQSSPGKRKKESAAPKPEPAPKPAPVPDPAASIEPDRPSDLDAQDALMSNARTREAVFKARDRELAYNLRKGALVERDKIKKEGEDISRILVQRLKAFPVRLSGPLASVTDQGKVKAIIDKEVTALIQEIQEAISAV